MWVPQKFEVPTWPSANPVGAQGLLHQALDAQRRGDHRLAESLCRQVLAEEPQDFNANHLIGVLCFQQGRPAEALPFLDQAVACNPFAAEAWAHQGLVRHALGRRLEALKSLDRALSLKPDHVEALNWRGMILVDLGRPAEALDSLKDALARNPCHAEALNNQGMALKALGRIGQACASLKSAAAIEPGNIAIQFNLGVVLREMGYCHEAATVFRRVVDVAPNHVAAINNLALTLCECDRAQEAMDYFRYQAALTWQAGANLSEHQLRHKQEQEAHLTAQGLNPLGLHIAAGERLKSHAVNPASGDTLARWHNAVPQVLVIDDLLSTDAFTAIRDFCLNSVIWRKSYANGYLGAIPETGFACPLLAQIAEELRHTYDGIFRHHPLRYFWAFNCAGHHKGVNIHADFAAVNVNFWITPDASNLDPDHGGLVIWDVAAPLDWDFARYNNDENAIRKFLADQGARSIRVPYKANRAVFFDSDLFHETDTINFKDGYNDRRINVTMLFGRRRIHEGLPARI